MDSPKKPQIHQIYIDNYSFQSGKFVSYQVVIQGKTDRMHWMAAYNRKTWTQALFPEVILQKRYSELHQLHQDLAETDLDSSLPKFPPKKFFGNKRTNFIQERIHALNQYWAEMLQEKSFRKNYKLMKLLEPSATITLVILGANGSGKSDLLTEFLFHTSEQRSNSIESFNIDRPKRNTTNDPGTMQRFPIDIIVSNSVVRINSLQIFTYDPEKYEEPRSFIQTCSWLKQGALLTFNPEDQSSYNIAMDLQQYMEIPSLLVWMGFPNVCIPTQYKCNYVVCSEDAYICFEELAGMIIKS